MKSTLNSKDYVTFARRFVKETVETMDYQELKNLAIGYIHEHLQKSYDDIGQISVFESMIAWNEDIFLDVAKDFELELEGVE